MGSFHYIREEIGQYINGLITIIIIIIISQFNITMTRGRERLRGYLVTSDDKLRGGEGEDETRTVRCDPLVAASWLGSIEGNRTSKIHPRCY